MLLADCARSRAYLQILISRDLIAEKFIILEKNDRDKPSQSQLANHYSYEGLSFNPNEGLKKTLDDNNISYSLLSSLDPNDSIVINVLKSLDCSHVIYGGVGGIILKKEILQLGKKILHIHPGRIPAFRGSTTAYYSMLKENKISASAFFFDEQIDTGPLIRMKNFSIPVQRELIDLIYDPLIRASLLMEIITDFSESGTILCQSQNDSSEAETYFIIHPVLKHVAILGNHEVI